MDLPLKIALTAFLGFLVTWLTAKTMLQKGYFTERQGLWLGISYLFFLVVCLFSLFWWMWL